MAKSMKSFLHPTEGHYKEMMTDRQYDGLRIIENEFGLKGYAIFWKLMEKICGSSEGYCIEWNDRGSELFAADLHVRGSLVREIVNRLLSVGVFDKALYTEHGVLTASFIQDNWISVKKRSYKIDEAYRLINCTQIQKSVCKTGQNANKKGKNACKAPPNLTERNLTELNLTERQTSPPEDLSVVELSNEEREELVRLSDRLTVERYISNLSVWQVKNRRKSKKAFAVIKKFIEEDKVRKSMKTEPSYSLDEWEDFALHFDPTVPVKKEEQS